jgi:hypothetical protein
MPADYQLDFSNRLVRTRAWDMVSAGDLFELSSRIHALFADGTIDAGWKELIDFRQVTRTELIPAEAVRQLAQTNPWPKSARRVIVAPVAAVFGISRMYQLLTSDDAELSVVRTEDEACELLSLPSHGGTPRSDSTID